MTRRVNTIRVPLTHRDAATLATYLSRFLRRTRGVMPPGSLLCDAPSRRDVIEHRLRTRALARYLSDASRFPSRTHVELSRELAQHVALVHAHQGVHNLDARLWTIQPAQWHPFASACAGALTVRRGRPFRTPGQLDRRIELGSRGALQVDDRELRRLKYKQRRRDAMDAWMARVEARGESLLSASEPLPI